MKRFRMQSGAGLVLLAIIGSGYGQAAPTTQPHPVWLGAEYNYVRTSTVAGCSCDSLQGGSAHLEFIVNPRLSLLAEAIAGYAGGVAPYRDGFIEVLYLFGGRYYFSRPNDRLRTFVEEKLGAAHSFGSLSASGTGASGPNAIAFEAGGGLMIRLTPRISLVPLQEDYIFTGFNNDSQQHQNDLRLAAGVVFRLHR